MPNVKKIIFDSPEGTGLSLECSEMRLTDDFYMDAADGVFKALPIADIWSSMIENVNDPGRYVYTESRTAWSDSPYVIAIRNAATLKRVGSGMLYIEGDTEKTILSSVTVSPAQITAGVVSSVVTDGSAIEWYRGDADRLSVSLGSAYAKTSARFYLCIKASRLYDNASAIVNREITITDAANVAGYIDLTADEMQTVGKYYAEIERRDSDGESNPKTCWQASWTILQDVRR